MVRLALMLAAVAALCGGARAAPPDHVPQAAVPMGSAPGMTVTELDPHVRRFHLVFQKGDDVRGGLAAFARLHHVTDASFTAVGAMDSALIGRSDRPRGFKVERLEEEMEIASMSGNIMRDAQGDPAVHAHCVVVLLRDGSVHAGHLLRGRVSLTLQLYLVDSTPLQAPSPRRE
jgi:predicted DNA-binding protein with PD1-like motif